MMLSGWLFRWACDRCSFTDPAHTKVDFDVQRTPPAARPFKPKYALESELLLSTGTLRLRGQVAAAGVQLCALETSGDGLASAPILLGLIVRHLNGKRVPVRSRE
jgi:hypothetical protein